MKMKKEKNSERTERDGHKRSANLKHPSMARTVSTGWSAQWQCDQTIISGFRLLGFFFFHFFGIFYKEK